MKKIYLYIKTHNKTGLKYFGKTVKDPHVYKGSGTRWLRHIKKYGYDVTTEIIGTFTDKEKCKEFAINFSLQNNIVESKEWANLIIEALDGGAEPGKLGQLAFRKKWNEDEQFRNKQIGILKENGKKNVKYILGKGYDWTGKKHKDESKKKIGQKNSLKQKGNKNSNYGNIWIRHPDIGAKLVKKELIVEYIEQGWFLGRRNWKNRIPPLNCEPKFFPGNINKRNIYKNESKKLFDSFCEGEYKSIDDFVKKSNYKHSRQNLVMLWKKYINGFSNLLMSYKSFSSEVGRSLKT
jgi:hypothetical protein